MLRLLLLVGFDALLNCVPAGAFTWDTAREQLALQLLREFQISQRVPSIAASAVINGRLLGAGVGDAKGSLIPAGESIRFHVGSITKQVIATRSIDLRCARKG